MMPCRFADTFILGFLAHLVSDLFLQNEYQALHKANLAHPAAWLHGGLSATVQVPVLGWLAVPLGLSHALIDTRAPLIWWRRLLRQTEVRPESHPAVHAFGFWQDQAAHLLLIGICAALAARRRR